ncbi:hypothetical protein AB0A69_22050 [Streptomyces sp. NPDC045431]|uniref:hypothetical protein n=1 Tax=Streptomyces sp. NPDC045431 TaxID=3155613 RepID=UPI0033D33A71
MTDHHHPHKPHQPHSLAEHLTDDVLARLATRTPHPDDTTPHRTHLTRCPDCRTRLAVWQDIGAAVRVTETPAPAEAATPTEAVITPPPFDALLGHALADLTSPASPASPAGDPRRAVSPALAPAPASTPGVARPWRTAWQLAVRQATLMTSLWAPLSAAGFVGAALLASAHVPDRFAVRLFGAVAVLLVMFGALMVASPARDPRRELLFTLPVPPAAVFLARLTVVLAVDVALAMACSTLVDGPGWWPVVSSWLGEALLAASLALALAVRHSPAVGAASGATLWMLGVFGGPQGILATPFDGLLDVLLATTPWTLLLAAALLAWAATAMRSFGASATPSS